MQAHAAGPAGVAEAARRQGHGVLPYYYRKLIRGIDPDAAKDLLIYRRTTKLNKAARDTSYNPERHDKTKHIERRHIFDVRDIVKSFELRVPFVRTDDN